MDQTAVQSSLRQLDRFVGEWTMTASAPGGPPWPGQARAQFEWLEGGAFLIERTSLSGGPEGAPTGGTSIVGCDAAHGTYVQLYQDDRGVCRIYAMGLHNGEWTLHREGPPFAQRFRGTFSADGATITGRWELQEDGEDWKPDFDLIYRRVTSVEEAHR